MLWKACSVPRLSDNAVLVCYVMVLILLHRTVKRGHYSSGKGQSKSPVEFRKKRVFGIPTIQKRIHLHIVTIKHRYAHEKNKAWNCDKLGSFTKFWFMIFFGQRPQRGRRPVEHRGTFVCLFLHPSVHLSATQALSGLKSALLGMRSALSGPEICPLRPWICPLRPDICLLRFKAWEDRFQGLRGLISGLRGQISDLRGPGGRTDGRMDGQTDGRTDGRTVGRTDKSPPVFYRTSSP